ncbi:hypothetical protein [Kitasatospora sp. NPDC008115]|uniref:hypothetical protein n=1 Tax=Kitasatospora sp. NPDC008115 TaxID=3364022 RepID=UPI0036E2A920
MGIAEFKGDCGEGKDSPKLATSSSGLQNGDDVQLNGNTNLSTCVVANDSAKVYGIRLRGASGVYDYQVEVDGEGPHGIGSGSMYTAFKDESGDIYHLELTSSSRKTHTVRYNSDKPAIMEFKWSNHSIKDW